MQQCKVVKLVIAARQKCTSVPSVPPKTSRARKTSKKREAENLFKQVRNCRSSMHSQPCVDAAKCETSITSTVSTAPTILPAPSIVLNPSAAQKIALLPTVTASSSSDANHIRTYTTATSDPTIAAQETTDDPSIAASAPSINAPNADVASCTANFEKNSTNFFKRGAKIPLELGTAITQTDIPRVLQERQCVNLLIRAKSVKNDTAIAQVTGPDITIVNSVVDVLRNCIVDDVKLRRRTEILCCLLVLSCQGKFNQRRQVLNV